jgi:cytidyltransferase-like protein
MVDGGFDPLHDGHVEYFRAASELGSPVLCNVSSDEYVGTKHPPLLRDEQRVRVIDAFRWVDYVHLSHTTTADVLGTLVPRAYAKGADWDGRLPDQEAELCRALGIEIVFLDTVRDSSTRILDDYQARTRR